MVNLIVTGIPRSGTTLAAAIIDSSPQAFCLSEPERHVRILNAARDSGEFVAGIVADFERIRNRLLGGEAVHDRRAPDGTAVTNYYDRSSVGQARTVTFALVNRGKPSLGPDFLLASKHNALYTAVLPELLRSRAFAAVALVRDPVNVVASWRSLQLPISGGRLPAGEKFWAELSELTRSEEDIFVKQLRIYDLFCRRYITCSSLISVIKYEELVKNPAVLGNAIGLDSAAIDGNLVDTRREQRPSAELRNLGRAISEVVNRHGLQGLSHYYPRHGY